MRNKPNLVLFQRAATTPRAKHQVTNLNTLSQELCSRSKLFLISSCSLSIRICQGTHGPYWVLMNEGVSQPINPVFVLVNRFLIPYLSFLGLRSVAHAAGVAPSLQGRAGEPGAEGGGSGAHGSLQLELRPSPAVSGCEPRRRSKAPHPSRGRRSHALRVRGGAGQAGRDRRRGPCEDCRPAIRRSPRTPASSCRPAPARTSRPCRDKYRLDAGQPVG